jgi:Transglutaminase-like superfamily
VLLSHWARLRQLSWAERWLLVEAGCWLGVTSLAVRLLPLRWIVLLLRQHLAKSSPIATPSARHAPVRRIGWAVETMGRALPWECTCLVQALAGKGMLRRRGVPSTLYLGVARQGQTALTAHAWLQCGSEILTGAAGHREFQVIATFAEDSAPPEAPPQGRGSRSCC